MGLNSLHSALLALIPSDLAQLLARQDLQLGDFVHGHSDGVHRSRAKGHGFEFRDHRPYLAGDDLRKVDWRAAARRDHPVIRQHESLSQRSIYLIADASAAMSYGIADQQKWQFAKAILAALAFLAERQRDRLAYLSSSDFQVSLSCAQPSAQRAQIGHVARQLSEQTPGGRCNWSLLLESATRTSRQSSLVFVVSDFLDAAEPGEQPSSGDERLRINLRRLRDLGHTVVMLQILHRDELEFPWTGSRTLKIDDLRNPNSRNSNSNIEGQAQDLRQGYLDRFRHHLEILTKQASQDGIFLYRFRTDQALAPAFGQVLAGLRSQDGPRQPSTIDSR